MSWNSAIYEGVVRHRRFRPVRHDLSYKVWYMLFDLDELDQIDRYVPGFANERRGAVSFVARDHGPRDGSPLRPWIEEHLMEAGVDLKGGPIRLLAFPRINGYAFNPITVWFCHGPLGDLRAVMFEVSNTFGEWHHYLVPVEAGTGLRADGSQLVRTSFEKELFVSPFMDMDATYDITARVPDQSIAIALQLSTAEGHMLSASFSGRRIPLTPWNLRKIRWRHPLLTMKVIGGIHWEAIRLWLKGAPYRRRGELPAADLTMLPAAREPLEVEA